MTSSDDGQQGVGGPPPADGSTPQEPSPPGQQDPGQAPQQPEGQQPPAPGQQQGYGVPGQQQGYGVPGQQQGYGVPGQQQGYGVPGQQQGYGAPGQQQGYGAPGQQQGYGAPGQQQGYGAPGQQQGYGAPGQQQGYGAPGQQQGYGAPGQQQGYGAPGQQQGYGAPGQQQGYGAPGQQQGYGAPGQQQGYGAPGQQQGYGVPGQQQGYGAPGRQQGYGVPGQQQGYGVPGQQQYTGPAQSPYGGAQTGGGQRRRPRWLLPGGIGAGVLAGLILLFFVVRIVLSATGGGTNPSQSGSGGPLSGKVLWSGYLPPPQPPSDSGQFAQEYRSTALESWLGGGVLAIVTLGSIVAVDQNTGKEKWSLHAPTVQGAPGAFCGRSMTSTGGLAAIGVAQYVSIDGQSSQACSTVMLIDLSTGKVRWTWSNGNTELTNPIHAEIVGSTVVADLTGDIYGLSVSSGQPMWQFQDTEVDTVPYDICDDQFMTTGSTLAVLSLCDQAPSVLSQLDPATGKVGSKTPLPSNMVNSQTEGELISASPGVIAVSGSQGSGTYLVVNGSNVAEIPQTGSYGTLDMEPMGGNQGHSLLPVVLSGNAMVTRNLPKNPNASRTPDDLVAFDLSTGKELWSKNLVTVSQSVPIAIQNGNVVAIVTGVYEAPPQAFQVSLKSGAAKALGPPYGRSLIETPNFSQLYWQNNHVYGAALTNIGKGFLLYGLG